MSVDVEPMAMDAMVIVPTVLGGGHVVPAVRDLFAHHGDREVLVVLSANPVDNDQAYEILHEIASVKRFPNVHLLVHHEEEPVGIAAACNRGLIEGLKWCERMGRSRPEFVVFLHDDAFVPNGWLQGIAEAFTTQQIVTWTTQLTAEDAPSARVQASISEFGTIGIVGPISNSASGLQNVQPPDRMGPDAAASWARQTYAHEVVAADQVGGFCLALSMDAVDSLMLYRTGSELTLQTSDHANEGAMVGVFDEVTYPIAGHEDSDLCVRAEIAGFRCAIAADTYVSHLGHQSLGQHWPEWSKGTRNRERHLRKWAALTQGQKRIVGVCRLKLAVPNDLNYFKMAVARVAQLCDGVSVLLTANPLEMRNTRDWVMESKRISPEDDEMLQACSGMDRAGVAMAAKQWIATFIESHVQGARFGDSGVVVDCWGADPSERDERNCAVNMAHALRPDWIFSFDADEVIENRITRQMLERWAKNPDPMVRSMDIGWLNHWNYTEQNRIDPPWGDGGRYVGGMHGTRLVRVLDHSAPRQIMTGSEENVPVSDPTTRRVAGLRMRHYGYLRPKDRQRQYQRHLLADPDHRSPLAEGGSYRHILDDEGMISAPYVAKDGIGLAMLVHEGERASDLARWFDHLHTVTDRIVLVWTGKWDAANKSWLAPLTDEQQQQIAHWQRQVEMGQKEVLDPDHPTTEQDLKDAIARNPRPRFGRVSGAGSYDSWPKTGPGAQLAEIAAMYGVEWVHHPLDMHIAKARNAALDLLGPDYATGLGWCLFYDPDEWYQEPFQAACQLRRMAESSNMHGWLVEVINFHEDLPPTVSESVRMSRNIPQMRMSSRVHEGFHQANIAMRDSGIEVRYQTAPIKLMHRGLAKDEEQMTKKLRFYHSLLMMELEENPWNSGAWVTLGLQLMNDGERELAVECWHRAVACGDGAFLGLRELAHHHMRQALGLFSEAVSRAGEHHPWVRAGAGEMLRHLREYTPEFPVLGSARRGVPCVGPFELPDFELPPEAMAIALADADADAID